MPQSSEISLTVRVELWPIAGRFAISRGAKTEAAVVVAELSDGTHTGRGECVPYARYGEDVAGVEAALLSLAGKVREGLDRHQLEALLPAGAARNALDCALWDLAAKRSGRRVWQLAGLGEPKACTTAFTISLGTPSEMADAAAAAAHRPLLKIKLGGSDDAACLAAVRAAAPNAELIVDANEGWREDNLAAMFAACADIGVTLIEQPLPAGRDTLLGRIARPVPVCADESVHDRASLAALEDRYDAVNIKLDKTGGLTEAIAMADEAERRGLSLMIGCMVATSLSMAPAMLLAPRARVVDLDGPLLLARDRPHGLVYEASRVAPPTPELWG